MWVVLVGLIVPETLQATLHTLQAAFTQTLSLYEEVQQTRKSVSFSSGLSRQTVEETDGALLQIESVLSAMHARMQPALRRSVPSLDLQHSGAQSQRSSFMSSSRLESSRPLSSGALSEVVGVEDVTIAMERYFESSGALEKLEESLAARLERSLAAKMEMLLSQQQQQQSQQQSQPQPPRQ